MDTRYQIFRLAVPAYDALKPIAINDNGQILCAGNAGKPSFWSERNDEVSFRINDTIDFSNHKTKGGDFFMAPGRHALLFENDDRTAKDLGMFSPESLNNLGQVVGYSADVDWSNDTFIHELNAVLWNGSEKIRLFDTPVFSQASGINDACEIVGTLDEPYETSECSYDVKKRKLFVWSQGDFSIIPAPRGYRVVKTAGMNDRGAIIAAIIPLRVRKGQTYKQIGISGKDGWQFIELPNHRSRQSAKKINNRNQVLCNSFSTLNNVVDARCYRWDAGNLTSIPFWGRDLNDLGQVVGFTIMDELSNRKAMLWHDGHACDLNDFIPLESGWTVNRADGINNRGQIIGRGIFEGTTQAFLLTPTSLSELS